MSTAFLEKMIIEEDHELVPKLKRMKINSVVSPSHEILRSNYIITDPKDHIKSVFPFFSEEVRYIRKFYLNFNFRK